MTSTDQVALKSPTSTAIAPKQAIHLPSFKLRQDWLVSKDSLRTSGTHGMITSRFARLCAQTTTVVQGMAIVPQASRTLGKVNTLTKIKKKTCQSLKLWTTQETQASIYCGAPRVKPTRPPSTQTLSIQPQGEALISLACSLNWAVTVVMIKGKTQLSGEPLTTQVILL